MIRVKDCFGQRVANEEQYGLPWYGVWSVSAVQPAVTISQSPFRATHVSDRANGGRFHGDESLPVIIGA